jgi:hypothetical protein
VGNAYLGLPLVPPLMPPLLLSDEGAAEEPEPGGHAVLFVLVPVLLFIAVELLSVELSDDVLPIWSQSLPRLELPDRPVLGVLIVLLEPIEPLVPVLEDCAAATPTVSARTEAAVRRRRVILGSSVALQS